MKRKSHKKKNQKNGKSSIEKYRTCLYVALAGSLAALVFTCYFSLWRKVPSNIKIKAGVDQTLDFQVPASGEIYKRIYKIEYTEGQHSYRFGETGDDQGERY